MRLEAGSCLKPVAAVWVRDDGNSGQGAAVGWEDTQILRLVRGQSGSA